MLKWMGSTIVSVGLLAGATALAQPVEMEGQKFDPTVQLGGQALTLNGVGLRKRAVFKVYVAGLYVGQKSSNPATLIGEKGPRRISLRMLRDVDADSFISSFNDGLKANLSEAELAAMKPRIDALTATFKLIGEAKKGDAIVTMNFRYRYEFVDDDAFDEEANASTLRSRLTLQSGVWQNCAFLAEFDDVRVIVADEFNVGDGNTPGRTEYPVVADPEGTELNQAYVDYTGIPNTTLRAGRQRFNLDNQRFVGGVGWRQNEETFDAASANYKFDDKLQFYYAYVDQVNRVFRPDAGAAPDEADFTDQTHLADVTYAFSPLLKLTAYGYFIGLVRKKIVKTKWIYLKCPKYFILMRISCLRV